MNEGITRKGFLGLGAVAGAAGMLGTARVSMASEAQAGSAGSMDMEAFDAWLHDMRNFSCAADARCFLPGEENAPTDDELVDILKVANSYMECHYLCSPHFVVIRDAEEQQTILPNWGLPETGTVTILCMADGCKDQEHHAAAYNTRHDNVHYWQMYYALDELGQAKQCLNMAARAKGFRVRNIGAISVPSISYEAGMGDQSMIPEWACGGDWEMIRADNWDTSRYTHAKDDESKQFTHWIYANDERIDLEGNLTLCYVLLMGKVDEDALDTSVSSFAPGYAFLDYPEDLTQKMYNFSFWDTGVDGYDLYTPDPTWEEAYAAWQEESQAEDGTEGEAEEVHDEWVGTVTASTGDAGSDEADAQ